MLRNWWMRLWGLLRGLSFDCMGIFGVLFFISFKWCVLLYFVLGVLFCLLVLMVGGLGLIFLLVRLGLKVFLRMFIGLFWVVEASVLMCFLGS